MPVLLQNRQRKIRFDSRRLRRVLRLALEVMGCSEVELSVSCVSERRMQELNARYRGIARVTDVLSFPAPVDVPMPDGAELLIGDVVVAPAVAARQAVEAGHDVDVELLVLCLHGLLHLLGYDHESSVAEGRRMRRQERRLLRIISGA